MPLTATVTARRLRAVLAVSTAFVRGLQPAVIASTSTLAAVVRAAVSLAPTIAAGSAVACRVVGATRLAALITAQSTVAGHVVGFTHLAPEVIASTSEVGARLLRDNFTRTTSAGDTRVTSAGDTRIVVQLA